jgi:2-polyprenyl-3-methyl-5-hydroxy-6-metoxy-1,4-benzoquinol methylase
MTNYLNPQEYSKIDEGYNKIYNNPIGKVLHRRRFKIIRNLVKENYSFGKKVIDFGCGLCEWNINKLNVIGLDVNEKIIKRALFKGNISEGIVSDILKNNLKENSFDIVVSSQILEHFENPLELITEIRRILKKDGILILAVPYDTFFSLWRPLFFIRCFIDGTIKRSKYYLKKGGHVQKFSPKTLKKLLQKNNFQVLKIVGDCRFSLTIVAKKIK